jgi:hypothetical protein
MLYEHSMGIVSFVQSCSLVLKWFPLCNMFFKSNCYWKHINLMSSGYIKIVFGGILNTDEYLYVD